MVFTSPVYENQISPQTSPRFSFIIQHNYNYALQHSIFVALQQCSFTVFMYY